MKKNKFAALSFAFLSSSFLFGFAPSAHADMIGTQILDFRGSAVGVYEAGGSSYSIDLTWNPEYQLPANCYLALNLGGTIVSSQVTGNILLLEYQAVLGQRFGNIGAELGAGAATFTSSGQGTAAMFSGNLYYHLGLPIVDKVFVSYSAITATAYVSAVKVGVGISF